MIVLITGHLKKLYRFFRYNETLSESDKTWLRNQLGKFNWIDILGVPEMFSGDYSSLSNKPVSWSWNNISDKPSSFPNHNISWSDIQDPPSIFNGDYNNLTGKPTVWDWSNISNKPSFFNGEYSGLTGKPVTWAWNDVTGKPSLFSGIYSDLTGKPTTWAWADITGKPSSFFSGIYSDLSGKPSIPILPQYNISIIPGAVTLGSKEITINVPGLLITDIVAVQPSVALPSGLFISHWRVSANDTLIVTIGTAILLGLSLGANSYACVVKVIK